MYESAVTAPTASDGLATAREDASRTRSPAAGQQKNILFIVVIDTFLTTLGC
jgi:hypothetical protein